MSSEKINNIDISKNKLKKLKNFCIYCNIEINIKKLVKYLKKIKISFERKNVEIIHEQTKNKINNYLLPSFKIFKQNMSETCNEFQTEILYGLLDSLIVQNLFKNNEKMSIQNLINIINDKFINSETNEDKFQIFINSIAFFCKDNNDVVLFNTISNENRKNTVKIG